MESGSMLAAGPRDLEQVTHSKMGREDRDYRPGVEDIQQHRHKAGRSRKYCAKDLSTLIYSTLRRWLVEQGPKRCFLISVGCMVLSP
jgi:hypothetical protein